MAVDPRPVQGDVRGVRRGELKSSTTGTEIHPMAGTEPRCHEPVEAPCLRPAGGPARPGRSEHGFTLLELLVVMIVLGLLAAIAVPIFLQQRARAFDRATASDVRHVATELAALDLEANPSPWGCILPPDQAGRTTWVWTTQQACGGTELGQRVRLSPGTTFSSFLHRFVAYSPHWCVSLSNPKGAVRTFRFSTTEGLEGGKDCNVYYP